MDVKKLFNIFQLFKKEGIDHTKLKFGEIKSADGKWVIAYQGDVLEAGMPVFIMDGGTQIPAPDGEIEMEDGRILVIEGGEGIVKEVKEKAPAEPAPASTPSEPAPMSAPNTAPEERMSKEEVSRIVQETVRKFYDETIKTENESAIAKFKSENELLSQAVEGLVELVQKIADQPAIKPTKEIKETATEKFSAQDQLNKIVKLTLKK